MNDLLAFYKYAFVILFILNCILLSDLLYAYKLKDKDMLRPGGIAYFGIGHYSVPKINYDSTQHPNGLCT